MIKTICLFTHAGGVGKTTGASVISSILAARGYRTLAVDMDPQSNLTHFLSPHHHNKTIEQALRGSPLPLIDLEPFLSLVPASPGLIAAEEQLRITNNSEALKISLAAVQNEYDFIVIDTHPSADFLAINALKAAEYLLVPALPDGKSLAGLSQIGHVFQDASHTKTIDGIYLSSFNPRRGLDVFIEAKLRQNFGEKVFTSRIRQCIALRECALHGMGLLSYAPRSNAAFDYNALVSELLSRINR